MKLIIPNVEIWQQGYTIENMWEHIARCTLVCRQAESIKNEETAEEFCKRTILAKEPLNNPGNHLAMLEHGTVYLAIPLGNDNYCRYTTNNYSRVCSEVGGKFHYITTNFRVLIENDWLDDLKYWCEPTEYHAKRITVCFITNIGVSREFNRHRVNSIAEESTRYCNYNKDKFDKQISIGLPAWLLDDEHLPYIESHQFDSISSYIEDMYNKDDDELLDQWNAMDFYLCALTFSSWCYNMLIKKDWTAQMAREVLPLATRTQLIHTAFLDDWKHFFKLRAEGVSGAPHPNAALLAKPLFEEFKKRNYV